MDGDIYILDGGIEDSACNTIGSRMRPIDSPIYRNEPDGRAEMLEALERIANHGHADDCLFLNRANEQCDCGIDAALLVIAKAKGETL